jgi:hypothetical protein
MSLFGKKPGNTYKDLLQIDNSNIGVDGTLRVIKDGAGTATPLSVSNSSVQVSSTPTADDDVATKGYVDTNGNLILDIKDLTNSGANDLTYVEWTGLSNIVAGTIAIFAATTSGGDQFRVQLGSSAGGYETSGYAGGLGRSSYGPFYNTTGFIMNTSNSTVYSHAKIVYMGDDEWSCTVTGDGGAIPASGMGGVTLAGPLDRIRVISVSSNTFTAGKASGFLIRG